MNTKIAVLDLGTNTFHLQIAEFNNSGYTKLYEDKQSVKIGQGGINNGYITEEALNRAINTLTKYKVIISEYGVQNIIAIATSAFRNASNKKEIIDIIKFKTGIDVQIIDGQTEAELIYYGICQCVKGTKETHLVIDIGGGSVEFIIGQNTSIIWKKSIEIGGLRLMEKFHQIDPIPKYKIIELEQYVNQNLIDVIDAINTFKPEILIGSSGSFDTLVEIFRKKTDINFTINNIEEDKISINEFENIYNEIIIKDRIERLQIPGMISLRVDMIVVSSVLIKQVLKHININEIVISTCSLKDGVIKQEYEKHKKRGI